MTTATETTLARLEAAFASLEEQGWFVDLGSHWCLTDAVDAVPDGKRYALAHRQDIQGLIEHGVIWIAYGATDDIGCSLDNDALVHVGRQVQQALLTHGLPAHWSGDPGHRIRAEAVS